jgi:integrase
MARARLKAVTDTSVGDLPTLIRSFERHLRIKNLAPRTIGGYVEVAVWFAQWAGSATNAADLTMARMVEWMEHLQATTRPATVANRYRSLQQFFKYLMEEGELEVSPLAKVPRPIVPETPVPVVSDDDLKALLKSVAGKDFDARRDNAILRLLIDCGVRLDEIGRLAVESIDFDTDEIVVWGKGRRPRIIPFSERTGQALERYLRDRRAHPWASKVFASDDADDPRNGNHPLWLGKRGWLSDSGLYQMVRRRSRDVLGEPIHPHQLRHTAAHQHAAAGMSETDMMRVFGWKSSEMPKRYGSSAADERARDAKRRLGLGNKF